LGKKLIWYLGKGALRAGYVYDAMWDYGNVGYYSFANGTSTQANGLGSMTICYGSIANSEYSAALGNNDLSKRLQCNRYR
jgi:hypothetical protein